LAKQAKQACELLPARRRTGEGLNNLIRIAAEWHRCIESMTVGAGYRQLER
jgi:hypothetical protein